MNRLSGHNTGSLKLKRTASFGLDGSETVDRVTQGVDDTAEVPFTDRDRKDFARTRDFLTSLNARELTEHDDTDGVLVKVQRETEGSVGELDEFVRHDAGESVHVRDSIARVDDVSDLFRARFRRLVRLREVAQRLADVIRVNCQFSHCCFPLCGG